MLAGCGIKYERNMTEAAQLTADKVCGIYQAVEATWDGEPLDVNNDGVAKESFLEELLDGPYLGIQYALRRWRFLFSWDTIPTPIFGFPFLYIPVTTSA